MRGPRDFAEAIETAVAAISATVVIAVIVFLVHEGVTRSEPSRLEVEAAAYDAAARRLAFTLRNDGGTAAAAVVVSAVTRGADGAVADRRSVSVEHVAPGSEVTGAFLLDGPAEIVVDGYLDP